MAKPPIRPKASLPMTAPKGDLVPDVVERNFGALHDRVSELESRTDLSGSVVSAQNVLSGSINSALLNLSGSVDSAIRTLTSGGLTFVTTDSTLTGQGTSASPLSAASLSSSIDSSIKAGDASLSGTVNARFLNITGSLISGLSETYSSLQAGVTSSVGSAYTSLQTGVTASVGTLSGTVNARFLSITGSLISGLAETYSSLQAGVTASVGSAYTSLQAGITSSVGSAYTSLQAGVTSSIGSAYSSLQAGVTSSVGTLSGTVDARFLNITGSLISGLAETYSSLQAGSTASIATLSGTINADFVALWSVAPSIPKPGDVSGSIDGAFKALSGTVDARFLNVTGSLISGLAETYSSLQAGSTASINTLSGTVDARFLNVTGSLISGLAEVYSSLQAGSTASILDAQASGSLAVDFQVFSSSIDSAIVNHGIDPRRSFQEYNDFLNMSVGGLGTAGGGTTALTWTPGHPGILSLGINLSASYAYWTPLFVGLTNGWFVNFTAGGGRIQFETMVATSNGNDATNQARYMAGFMDSVALDSSNGIWFENDWAKHGNSKWWICTAYGGSRTKVAMGTASDPADWIRLHWELAENGDVVTGSWYYNDVLQGTGTINTNIAAIAQTNIAIAAQKQASSAGRTFQVDYYRFWQIFTGSRQ